MINTKLIKSLSPCSDRLNNYLKHYGEFEGSLSDFLSLSEITHKDKLWVTFRVLDRKQVVECACRFAESVLELYESKYPGDLRPRQAIEAARSGDKPRAYDAADAAAAYAAVDAAAYAAAYAAYAAAAAADAADAAAAYAAVDAAAYAAAYVAARSNARSVMESKQIEIILAVVRETS